VGKKEGLTDYGIDSIATFIIGETEVGPEGSSATGGGGGSSSFFFGGG